MVRHIVVTPVRDEVAFLPSVIHSMATQTILPNEWIIVDDGSTDGSREVLDKASKRFEWIKVVDTDLGIERARGEKIARLVNLGLENASADWSFFSKIDADMILPDNYFEKIIEQFESDRELGIGSGNCFLGGDSKKIEKVESDHTRGGLKTYRGECFSDIGGIREIDGWDGLDNKLAQYNGWKTKNFSGILAEHKRATGEIDGAISNFLSAGKKSHIMCYTWTFLIAKSLASMLKRPIIIGGLCIIIGFIKAKITRTERIKDKDLVNFIRRQQRRKLLRRISMRFES